MKTLFGTKYQMIEQRFKEHNYEADRRPKVQMFVEFYKASKYDHKFLLVGFLIGLVPYIVHMKF
tara:strand:- start:966 stop:1157 length:192 start_codon:yes stop_codon:yes gene_type:complete